MRLSPVTPLRAMGITAGTWFRVERTRAVKIKIMSHSHTLVSESENETSLLLGDPVIRGLPWAKMPMLFLLSFDEHSAAGLLLCGLAFSSAPWKDVGFATTQICANKRRRNALECRNWKPAPLWVVSPDNTIDQQKRSCDMDGVVWCAAWWQYRGLLALNFRSLEVIQHSRAVDGTSCAKMRTLSWYLAYEIWKERHPVNIKHWFDMSQSSLGFEGDI